MSEAPPPPPVLPPAVSAPAGSPAPAARKLGLPGDQGLTLDVIWRAVRKSWHVSLLIVVSVVGVVTFRTLNELKIYEAQATVMFDPNPPRPLGAKVEAVVELGSGNGWDTREYYETQYQVLQSQKLAQAVVRDMGLHRDHAFLRNLPSGAMPSGSLDPVSEAMAADELRRRFRVEAVKNSRIARVRLEDANPERAAKVLDRLVNIYVELNLSDAMSSTQDASEWLRGQLDKLRTDLESSEMALHDYKKDKNILSVSFDDQSNMLREEMRGLNTALTTVRAKREEFAAKSSELGRVAGDNPDELGASDLLSNSALTNARASYQSAVAARDSLVAAKLGPNHPELLSAEAKVVATRRALLTEARNIKTAVARDLAVVTKHEAGLARLFERAKQQALEINLLEVEYNKLKRDKENTEKLYQLVQEREKESGLTRMMRVNNIRVLDRPRIPSKPIRPNVPINLGAGLAIGLLLGLGAAVLRSMFDRTIKTPDDVENKLSSTFLGLIPEFNEVRSKSKAPKRGGSSKESPELVVHTAPAGAIAEASRVVRTNLIFMAPDNPYKRLLITSAAPWEGKTTFACCIATAVAQSGKRVVLVDCDLRRPRVHRIFGTGSDAGLTTALFDDGSLDEAIRPTVVDNLSVLAAGPIPPNPADLLQSDRFRRILRELDERFDWVILDSPPVAVVTDAVILSKQVDATVMVVRAFRTQSDTARYALRSLLDVGANLAGIVLNAVNLDRDEYKYGYRYYRKDQYKYTSDEPKLAARAKVASPASDASAPPDA